MQNNIKFDKEYDVIVAGLGSAGAIALISAAKRGLKVLGIEHLNNMGGTGTLGAIPGYYFGSTGGLYKELNIKANQLNKRFYIPSDAIHFNAKAYILESEARAHGAEFLYESIVTKVYTQGTHVTGVKVFSGGEFIRIGAKIIIDCTGEADICHLAGCELSMGRRYDGQTQPYSNIAITGNNSTIWTLNQDSGYVRQHDPMDLSRAVISSLAFLKTTKDTSPPDMSFYTSAMLLGVREGRTIVGEQTLTLEDFFRDKPAENPLFYAYSNIDNHGKDTAFEDEILTDWYVAAGLWGVNMSVGVPMGAIIPKGYTGILTAGRCLAVDHNMAPCVRMRSDMEKCGEAAATLAYLSIKDNRPPKEVDYHKLTSLLKETEVLSKLNDVGFINRQTHKALAPFTWITNVEKLIDELDSGKPGIAIWSAKLLGARVTKALEIALESGEPLLRKHAAIALGLQSNPVAREVLEEMAAARDGFIPSTCAKYTYTHATSAIYLLGKLACRESLEVLLDIIRTEGDFPREDFRPDELYATEADVRFQYVSYALAALSKIAEKHPDTLPAIRKTIEKSLLKDGFTLRISLKSNPYIEHDMADKLKEFARCIFRI